ncbi:MAG: mannose-1-phosphate guanylyltransferase/mannose-6-phosphate isomerase [Desulfurivibrionaceae bacterium]|nr:mannose-1-phosphate guanylyltransferase/mannose-6-phosphate isomerase [Desulfobulbales bacterium]MDT8334339.1 mannose-1-phosphate guanylyltransferase/mannose-6-phosphate isomerase [Desulfurivibrionaceae bacterium]
MMIPVIMAGGSGTRLWPLSRELYPKQFLALTSEETMFQSTVARCAGMAGAEAPIILCKDEHRFLVGEQLQRSGAEAGAIILEPVGRNTAPAVAVAALQAMAGGDDPVLLILPSDHVITAQEKFRRAVTAGERLAAAGSLITFGIVPDCPETGYGYIKSGSVIDEKNQAFRVDRFVEKPDLKMAEKYLESGDYLWNSGMFMFKASVLIAELDKYAPGIMTACRAAFAQKVYDLDFIRLDRDAFSLCPDESIDYAVMEKTAAAAVIPIDCGWSDVGSWAALHEVSDSDAAGNVIKGDVIVTDTSGCYLRSESRLVAAVGLRDHIVIETSDAVVVAPRNRSQDVKAIVEQLRAEHRSETVLHRRVYRPWGSYEGVDSAARFQVKRITVKPGGCLSLQMHHHRAEHWVVVSGTARVTVGDQILTVSENQSTYIPVGEKHRLENPGIIDLELIEIQTGPYLGEDDIVRFDDVYGRQDANLNP